MDKELRNKICENIIKRLKTQREIEEITAEAKEIQNHLFEKKEEE